MIKKRNVYLCAAGSEPPEGAWSTPSTAGRTEAQSSEPPGRRTPTPCKSRVKRSWDEHPREEGQPPGAHSPAEPSPRSRTPRASRHRNQAQGQNPAPSPNLGDRYPRQGVSGWCHPAPSSAQSVRHSRRNTAIFFQFHFEWKREQTILKRRRRRRS